MSTAERLPDLLPCPFCGHQSTYQQDGYGSKWVCCEGCGVSTSETGVTTDLQAIERWNKRAPADGGGHGVTPLSERTTQDLVREVAEMQHELLRRICGDPVAGIGLKVGTPASTGGEDRG